MNTITTVAEIQSVRSSMSGSVGLVPTMGAIHEGHLSLVRRALADSDHVVVTIFVNPTQFNESADFEHYPRDTDRDIRLLRESIAPLPRTGEPVLSEVEGGPGVRVLVFMPSADEIYPPGFDDWVEVTGPLSDRLEGAARPGHFRGVVTVVARLFRIIRPTRAYFGQKDAQQLRVIRRMVTDLKLGVEIVPMPIIRDPDGLALSSRNIHLSPDQRRAALALPRALALARRLVMDEGVSHAGTVREGLRDLLQPPGVRLSSSQPAGRESAPGPTDSLERPPTTQPDADVETPQPPGVRLSSSQPAGRESAPGPTESPERPTTTQPDVQALVHLEYISVSDEQTLEELQTIDRPALILLAARIGPTRLIDNTIVISKGMPIPAHLAALMQPPLPRSS